MYMYIRLILICCLLLSAAGCAGSGKEAFDKGQGLYDQNNLEEAIGFFQAALKLEPGNKEYQQLLDKALASVAAGYFEKARNTYSAGVKSEQGYEAVFADLRKALQYTPDDIVLQDFGKKVTMEKKALLGRLDQLYADAAALLAAGDYIEALRKLDIIDAQYLGFVKGQQLRADVVAKGVEDYLARGKQSFREERYEEAVSELQKALALDPQNVQANRFLLESQSRDSVDYYIGKAADLYQKGNFQEAYDTIHYAERLYGIGHNDLRNLKEKVIGSLADEMLRKAEKYHEQGKMYHAVDTLRKLIALRPEITSDFDFYQVKDKILQAVSITAFEYANHPQAKLGNAYYYLSAIKELNPSFAEIFYRIQNVEDRIKARVNKAIAIMDFQSPTNNQDAGRIFSSSLTTYLFRIASADIQILERSDIQPLLEELNLNQTGMFDLKAVQNSGALSGIDYFILGSVLNYSVASEEVKGKRYAKMKIGVVNQENVDYLNWKARNPTPTREELMAAPAAVLQVPEYKEIQYDVTTTKKVAFVDVFYKMIDTANAGILFTKNEKEKLVATDDYVSGVPEANIPDDPFEILTDNELLEQLTTKQISQMGANILERLLNMEKEYLKEGDRFLERKEYEAAVEAYFNAIIDENIKGIKTEVSDKARVAIENAYRQLEMMQ